MRRNSLSTHRRAAPIPLVVETVSESVWRVPKETIVAMSERSRVGSTSAISAPTGHRSADTLVIDAADTLSGGFSVGRDSNAEEGEGDERT
jgi:hypothetical protein